MTQVINNHNKLGIVIVTYGNEDTIRSLLDKLGKDKKRSDSVVLVDNHPSHKCALIAENHVAVDVTICSDNVGLFAGGCNRGAAELPSDIDLVFFLNPDTMPLGDALDKIRHGKPGWGAWMPLLLLPDGKVNSAGNIIHVSGLSWVSHLGDDASDFTKSHEVSLLSGACMVIRKKVWDEIVGFAEIMYYEDVDISLRMRLRGHKLGILPKVHIEHDYVFDKGKLKNFYLERNRYLLILRTWPAGVILVLSPMLIIVELGLWAISILQRRFLLRIRSSLSSLKALPHTLRERREIRQTRAISTGQFLSILGFNADSPMLGFIGRSSLVNFIFAQYYRFAAFILRAVV